MKKTKAFGTLESLIAVFLCISFFLCVSGAWTQNGVAEKVIRLHIPANSDSEEDQSVKLAVRDAVLDDVRRLCADSANADEARDKIKEHLSEIENRCNEVLRKQGFSYFCKASLCCESFPTREYESFTLPAGKYTSLTLRLGESKGKNWWCIVFPYLCGGEITEASVQTAGLTPLQSRRIRSDKVKIKFRIYEYFQKISQLLS